MRIPSKKKPHFFSFVCPQFGNGALIPVSFFCKYLNGQKYGDALLRRGCWNWPVKIDGRRFVDGWEKFEEDNGLEEGDAIVFRHDGDMVFEAKVFDKSACEKELSANTFFPSDGDYGEKEVGTKGAKRNPKAKSSKKATEINGSDIRNKSVKSCVKVEQPYFVATLRQCNMKNSILYLPNSFSRSNGLSNGEMVIRDDKGRLWKVELRDLGKYVYIQRGWSEFRIANELKEGDVFKFELIENGKKPIANFRCRSFLQKPSYDGGVKEVGTGKAKESPEAKSLNELTKTQERSKKILVPEGGATAFPHFEHKPSSSKVVCHPYFMSTMTQFMIKSSILYIPMMFARSHGLSNRSCEMILRDEKLRLWTVKLMHDRTHASIRRWRDLRIANGLKEGDSFMLELIEKGEKPVMNFRLSSK